MTYAGAAAILLGVFLLFRRSSKLGRSRLAAYTGVSVSGAASGPPVGRCGVTDFVLSLWVVGSVYAILLILKPPIETNWAELSTTVVPLAAACAALERWRWSRYALLGMSVLILTDTISASTRLAFGHGLSLVSALASAELWQTVLSGFTGSPWFGAGVVGLAAATVLWLPRPSVSREFEHRKRLRTRHHQLGIAAALVAAYCCGLTNSGLSRSVGQLLQDRARAAESFDRIALRSGATISPGGRR